MATILIADDDTLVRTTMKAILRAKGHDIIEAENGQEAIDIVRNVETGRTISLVVTDILMPKVDGLSLIAELMKIDGGLKILAVSGGGRMIHSNFLNAARNGGAHDVLKKPFTHHQLLEKVDGLLQKPLWPHQLRQRADVLPK
jgi:two-component system cell cycle sensor histidine kinase/response regulator CckA